MSGADDIGTVLDLPDVFLPCQAAFMAAVDEYRVVVAEKGRRTGFSWTAAAIATLYAATRRGAGGMDVYYIAYDKDMTREFIDYCAEWAKTMEAAASEVEESFFIDPDHPEKQMLTFRVGFASGFEVVALPSVARALRGKQGLVIIDEAAFADNLAEILKAAMALLIWGGKVVIISTHNGTENEFNTLVNDIRAGRKKYKLLRTTFDDAIADGLYRRICLKENRPWSLAGEIEWRQEIIEFYGANADEELFCVPTAGTGAFLSAAVIEARMVDTSRVIRYQPPDGFLMYGESTRNAMIAEFCEVELAPVLRGLDKKTPHCFGQDFGRKRDLSVFWPLAIERSLIKTTPFVLEMRNTPYEAQKQIVFYIIDRLPLFRAGKFDATGNGGYLAEVALQKYGERIEAVMLNEPWYRENMPKWKADFEDGMITIPRDREILDDHRLVKLIRGVGRIPEERTGDAGKKRHGDSAVASALAIAASRAEPEEYGYEGAGRLTPVPGMGPGYYEVFFDTAAQANAAQEEMEKGIFPKMSRRIY